VSQQNRSHEELLDLVAVYALGALNGEEAEYIAGHIAECDDCRREFEALKPAADAVALSVDDRLDAVNCPRMKSRLMEAVTRDLGTS